MAPPVGRLRRTQRVLVHSMLGGVEARRLGHWRRGSIYRATVGVTRLGASSTRTRSVQRLAIKGGPRACASRTTDEASPLHWHRVVLLSDTEPGTRRSQMVTPRTSWRLGSTKSSRVCLTTFVVIEWGLDAPSCLAPWRRRCLRRQGLRVASSLRIDTHVAASAMLNGVRLRSTQPCDACARNRSHRVLPASTHTSPVQGWPRLSNRPRCRRSRCRRACRR